MKDQEPLIGSKQDAMEMTRALTQNFRSLQTRFLELPPQVALTKMPEMAAIMRFQNRLVEQFFLEGRKEISSDTN